MKANLLAAAAAAALLFSAPVALAQSGSSDMAGTESAASAGKMNPSNLTQDQVKQVQQALSDKGQQVDVDGIWGPNTKAALKEFQQAQGMQTAQGNLDPETISALGIEQSAFMAGAATGGPGAEPEVGMGGSSTSSSSSMGGSSMGNAAPGGPNPPASTQPSPSDGATGALSGSGTAPIPPSQSTPQGATSGSR